MLRKTRFALLLLALLTCSVRGGIRAPGEYSGIVVFDHWDTCYLYDGTFLMYVSERVKERLRQYDGRTIRINATEVYQPMNPGDGLITDFKFLGLANDQGHSPIDGLVLTITPRFEIDRSAQFVIDVRNTSTRIVEISNERLAPTLLGEKDDGDIFSPSDGKSEARITRWGFPWAKGEASTSSHTLKGPDGQTITVNKWYGLTIDDGQVPFDSSFVLRPGQSRQFKAAISASPGDYEFLCGYRTGWPGSEEQISNRVFFTVDAHGATTVNPESKPTPVLINSQLISQAKPRNVIQNRMPSGAFFSWMALARAITTFVLAFVIYRRLYHM